MSNLYLVTAASSNAPEGEDWGIRQLAIRLDLPLVDWLIGHVRLYKGLNDVERGGLIGMRYLLHSDRLVGLNWEAIEEENGGSIGHIVGPETDHPILDTLEASIPSEDVPSEDRCIMVGMPFGIDWVGVNSEIRIDRLVAHFFGAGDVRVKATLKTSPTWELEGDALNMEELERIRQLVRKLAFFQQDRKEEAK